jgi:hypothetical protein
MKPLARPPITKNVARAITIAIQEVCRDAENARKSGDKRTSAELLAAARWMERHVEAWKQRQQAKAEIKGLARPRCTDCGQRKSLDDSGRCVDCLDKPEMNDATLSSGA